MLAMNKLSTRSQQGFTLVELMTTLAIAAVLMLIAAPSFTNFQRNSELTSLTNKLVGAINSARGEAMKSGRNAYVIPLTASDWSGGWQVYVDMNNNDRYDTGTDTLILSEPAIADYLSVVGTNSAAIGTAPSPHIGFNNSGFARSIPSSSTLANLSLTIKRKDTSTSNADAQSRIILVARTGRTRACTPSTDSNCKDSATD